MTGNARRLAHGLAGVTRMRLLAVRTLAFFHPMEFSTIKSYSQFRCSVVGSINAKGSDQILQHSAAAIDVNLNPN
jgi:hypothetical protein